MRHEGAAARNARFSFTFDPASAMREINFTAAGERDAARQLDAKARDDVSVS